MANYSIKDLENFTGIKAHTIRIWEKRYNVVEPKRTCTNIRYYDDEDLKRLLNVSILNRNGFKISNIVNFSEKAISEKILSLSQSKKDVESQIESLVIAMIDLDESRFDKIFNTAVLNFGFEETILRLIYPFFEKIGILWQVGTINPGQEHFISNLIRQKLIVAIDGIVQNLENNSDSYLLFLPEGEYHELGLLFYQYFIKKNNNKIIYLGESVPIESIQQIYKDRKINYLLTSIVTSQPEEKYKSFVEVCSSSFPGATLYLTGQFAGSVNIPLPSNVEIIKHFQEFKTQLNKSTKS